MFPTGKLSSRACRCGGLSSQEFLQRLKPRSLDTGRPVGCIYDKAYTPFSTPRSSPHLGRRSSLNAIDITESEICAVVMDKDRAGKLCRCDRLAFRLKHDSLRMSIDVTAAHSGGLSRRSDHRRICAC
jgi:hypothetical protein